ncbi:MAG: hypothetical protein AAFO94_14090 [Bacteroidota bacterium]
MKYLLTLLALISLYNILMTPSEVVERDNAEYMRKRARASAGNRIPQAQLTSPESLQRSELEAGIGSCTMCAPTAALQSCTHQEVSIALHN